MALAPLRIGIVAHGGPGGSGTVAASLAHALAGRGHEVHLVTPGRCARAQSQPRLTVHPVEAPTHPMWEAAPWSLALAGHLAAVAQTHDLDLLHAHFAVPYAIAADLARQPIERPLPLVATLHGTDATQLAHEPSYGPLVRLTLSRADSITVPSQALCRRAAEIAERPVEVVPNFFDDAQFRPDPSRPAPSAGEVVIAHASTFRPVKRLGDVVAIFARVAEVVPARLLLVGDGPDRQRVLAELARLGLRDRVEAPGERDDVERWLARAHVTLVPSNEESFGLAALESLACGTPVVGSRVGGLVEVVTHEKTGLLSPIGAVDAMAADVLSLVGDDDRHHAFATAAAADARARFSTATAVAMYERIYRRVASRSDRPLRRVR